MPAQRLLIQALVNKKYRPLGSDIEKESNFQLILATNRDINEMILNGQLGQDFYDRFSAAEYTIPPLRERVVDLVYLIEEIRREIASRLGRPVLFPTPAALERLAGHSWPGNVRELINFFERIAACWPGEAIDDRLAAVALGSPGPRGVAASPRDEAGEVDLTEALGRRAGNVSRTARELGLPRSTLRYRLARLAADSAGPSDPEGVGAGPARQLWLPLSRPHRGGAP